MSDEILTRPELLDTLALFDCGDVPPSIIDLFFTKKPPNGGEEVWLYQLLSSANANREDGVVPPLTQKEAVEIGRLNRRVYPTPTESTLLLHAITAALRKRPSRLVSVRKFVEAVELIQSRSKRFSLTDKESLAAVPLQVPTLIVNRTDLDPSPAVNRKALRSLDNVMAQATKAGKKPICLPTVKTLLETGQPWALDRVSLPALKTLMIEELPNVSMLKDFLRRSPCPIQNLVLTKVDGTLVDILRLLPTLRDLRIALSDYDPQLVDSLRVSKKACDGFLPVLERLSLDVTTYGPVSELERPVLEMVESRRIKGVDADSRAGLKSFTFIIASYHGYFGNAKRELSARFKARFEGWKGQNMQVHIRTRPIFNSV